ncbi:ribosomal maturation YjgA family protein [Mycetocola manganoxydans]|uniref:ribosomal maturation YjgA family protein n=1 Tax=Mycetocola manganoxydans TaxID=699879 RepID=UPI0016007248|nr:DUF2809 domain-containing protein [Mycetocola manganoxydans]
MTTNSRAAILVRRTPPRRRPVLVGVIVLVVVVGLSVRGVPGPLGDGAGGILYAVLVYAVIAMLAPAAPAAHIGIGAAIVCTAVELLQLTGLPSSLGAALPPVRYVLGTTFVWTDLITGALGAVVAVLADGFLLRLRRRRRAQSVQ